MLVIQTNEFGQEWLEFVEFAKGKFGDSWFLEIPNFVNRDAKSENCGQKYEECMAKIQLLMILSVEFVLPDRESGWNFNAIWTHLELKKIAKVEFPPINSIADTGRIDREIFRECFTEGLISIYEKRISAV